MYGASKPDPLVSSVEDGVVAMEKVESEYPVPNFGAIHKSELALACRVLHICTSWQLIGDVIDSERNVIEPVEVFPRAAGCREAILKFVELQS